MSLRAVHAGTGYQYLLRSVATHDADPEEQSLSDYYAAKGTPPGRWIGRGIAGLESESVTVGATVTERQMAALYGEGLHPDADDKLEAGEPLSACKLGRAFPFYTAGVPVLEALSAAEKAFRQSEGRRPDEVERGEIAEKVGRPFYMAEGGYSHASGADVIAFVNRERDKVRQAVAGFDFTFSPVKSVSVLWALADEKTASQIAAIHHEAVAEALAWAEDNAVYTRVGTNGIEQVKTKGIVASEFTHFDTRGGDPDLHSHVLLANKVQTEDGQWKTLDSRTIHQMHQVIGARYNNALQDRLARRIGLEFTARYPDPTKSPVWEVAGVPARLCDAFSSRRRLARPVYEQLVAEYVAKHGHQPAQRAGYALWQKAILDTRDAKKPAESLSEHRRNWRESAVRVVGEVAVDRLLDDVRAAGPESHARPVFDPAEHADTVAAEAIRAVTGKRAQFRTSHVDTAVSVALKGYRFTSDDHRRHAHDVALRAAMTGHAVRLTPGELLDLPSALTAADGAAIDRRANAEVYTTRGVLEAENTVLDAAGEPVTVFATDTGVDAALARHQEANGWSLNDGQTALARHLANSGTLVAAGVGPAGTGKTASMKVVVDTWQSTGRNVHGLAPSAAAASVLAEETGADSHTIDSLVFTWRGHHPTAPGRSLDALPVTIREGDMLLVDEAGMASTDQLAALTDIARQAGAVVRLIGDPHQLSAVAGGGLFAAACQTPGTPELRDVMRMGADREQADATLALRHGDASSLDVYTERGWVTGGAREQMLTDAVAAYLADTEAGRDSLIIAARNTDVDTMNEVIRAHRIDAGQVDTSQETTVARGDIVGVGDTVITRSNSTLRDADGSACGRVLNGQLFTVTGLAGDGSLAVRDRRTGDRLTIPAHYATDNVHLGYASTIHRAQGATVDTTHAVVDTSVDRAGLYVAMTRGKHENRAYAVCEAHVDPFAEDAHMHSAGDQDAPTPRQVLETVLARDTRERSATEALRDELGGATSPERLEALYRHGTDLAAAAFTAETLPAYLDALPRALAAPIENNPDQRAAVERAWTDAALAGHDPRQAWTHATDGLAAADRPGALLAHRIREATGPRDGLPTAPPATAGGDAELAAWLATTRAELTSQTNSAAENDRLDAARDRMTTSTLARLDDHELATRLRQARTTVEQTRAYTERAEERLAGARRLDEHERDTRYQELLRRHAELDAHAEAIGQAIPIGQQLREVRAELRRADTQRRNATIELAKLGRMALRRRADAQQRLEVASTDVEHWQHLERHLAEQWHGLTRDLGPEHTWDRVLAEAADTDRRQRDLDNARRDNRVHQATFEPSTRQARQRQRDAETTLADLTGEIDRRAALTDAARAAEDTARTEHHRQRQAEPDEAFVNGLFDSYLSARQAETSHYPSPDPSPGLSPDPSSDYGIDL
ncbi:MobF family relaxase [Dietzia cinnamea]|uniref:MobF family relaxase n=1 Tax=Dietzia cinnamea TaxID=321318 RepID=UPI00223C2A89|nr:MobF family relaxase [Dietzia cinnamea]MCT2173466.1 relaxase domain-containing protein [Dietzia cinnamea]